MIKFNSLLLLAAVAVVVPLLLGLVPTIKAPAVVFEIIGGVVVGPSVLDWVHRDAAVRVVSDLGLGYLLFLAGYEIELRLLNRHSLDLVGRAFVISATAALGLAYALQAAGLVKDGLLVGITLLSTSLGVLVPILKDTGQSATGFGILIMTAASFAELVPLIILSLFFSAQASNSLIELGFFGLFVVCALVGLVIIRRVRNWTLLQNVVVRLEDSSSQLRVRLSIILPLAFAVMADHFGLATILGAFVAGLILRSLQDAEGEDLGIRSKLEAIGFGFLIPIFFVSTGASLDVTALFHSGRAIADVPLFLAALLIARGVPALLYRNQIGRIRSVAAGFMQATNLTFIIVATEIGVATGHERPTTAAALVVAGLLSVTIYPAIALRLLNVRIAEGSPS